MNEINKIYNIQIKSCNTIKLIQVVKRALMVLRVTGIELMIYCSSCGSYWSDLWFTIVVSFVCTSVPNS
jgi:hypothetical protein